MSASAFPYGAVAAAAAPTGDTLALTNITSYDGELSGTATTGLRVRNNGNVERVVSGVLTAQNPTTEWIDNKSANMSLYECRLTKTSGTDPQTNPGLNTWLNCGTNRVWYLSRSTTPGITQFIGTLEIREVANTSNIVSATVTLTSEIII